MKILQVSNEEDAKILRTVSVATTLDDCRELIDSMVQHVLADKNCKGLAAPQVGHNVRLFVIKHGSGATVYINPSIIWQSRKCKSAEKCLSCGPREYEVERFAKINVQYTNRSGVTVEEVIKNFNAFTFQHELSHLDGITILDACAKPT